MAKKPNLKKKPVEVRERNYLYGEPADKTIIVKLTATEHRKVMRKVGKDRTIKQWFLKVANLK